MSEKPDYRSMRVLPISTLLLLLIIPLRNISMLVLLLDYSLTGRENLEILPPLNTAYFTCEFFNIVASVVVLVCLYRLIGISKSFQYAWIAFVIEMMSELLRQMMGIFVKLNIGSMMMNILAGIFDILPKLLVMVGVAIILNGLKGMCNKINKTDGAKRRFAYGETAVSVDNVNRLKKIWLVVEVIRIFIGVVLYVSLYMKATIPTLTAAIFTYGIRITGVLSVILILIHSIVSVLVFGIIEKVFRNYYLYRYNKGE